MKPIARRLATVSLAAALVGLGAPAGNASAADPTVTFEDDCGSVQMQVITPVVTQIAFFRDGRAVGQFENNGMWARYGAADGSQLTVRVQTGDRVFSHIHRRPKGCASEPPPIVFSATDQCGGASDVIASNPSDGAVEIVVRRPGFSSIVATVPGRSSLRVPITGLAENEGLFVSIRGTPWLDHEYHVPDGCPA